MFVLCVGAIVCSKLQTRVKVNPNACPSDTAEKERKKKSGPGLIKPSVARSVWRNKTESPPEAPQCRWRLPQAPGSLSLRSETRFQHLHSLPVLYSAIKNTVTPLWPPEDRFVWSRRETCAASPLRSSSSLRRHRTGATQTPGCVFSGGRSLLQSCSVAKQVRNEERATHNLVSMQNVSVLRGVLTKTNRRAAHPCKNF